MFETDSFCAETSFIGSESSFAEDPSETVDCDGTSSPAASLTADEEVPSDNEAPRMDLLDGSASERFLSEGSLDSLVEGARLVWILVLFVPNARLNVAAVPSSERFQRLKIF